MQGWQTPYLGQRDLPRALSQFELQAFFSYSAAERELIGRRCARFTHVAAPCSIISSRPASAWALAGCLSTNAARWAGRLPTRSLWCTPEML